MTFSTQFRHWFTLLMVSLAVILITADFAEARRGGSFGKPRFAHLDVASANADSASENASYRSFDDAAAINAEPTRHGADPGWRSARLVRRTRWRITRRPAVWI